MKKIITLLFLCSITCDVTAQQFMPATNNSTTGAKESKRLISEIRSIHRQNRKSSNTNDADKELLAKKKDSLDRAMDVIVDDLNKSANLTLSGIGGVSNLESIGQSGGNLSLTAKFRLKSFRKLSRLGWVDQSYLYMAFNTRTNASEDSGSLTKSFMFPDISKRDFVLGFYYSFQHTETGWSIDPTIELSLNRHKLVKDTLDSSVPLSFNSESAMFGIKLTKLLAFNITSDSSYDAGFTLFPYYSIVNVQPKNFDNYNSVMNEGLAEAAYLPPSVHSIGLQAGIMLSKMQLIANGKYTLNNGRADLLPDMKGFTYTISTIIAVDLLKFNLYKR